MHRVPEDRKRSITLGFLYERVKIILEFERYLTRVLFISLVEMNDPNVCGCGTLENNC